MGKGNGGGTYVEIVAVGAVLLQYRLRVELILDDEHRRLRYTTEHWWAYGGGGLMCVVRRMLAPIPMMVPIPAKLQETA